MGLEPSANTEELGIASGEDVVKVRQLVRARALAAGLSLVDQTKMVTAASELARNALVHGGGGRCLVAAVADGERTGLRIEVIDEGPGIKDMDLALTDGYSSGAGLGLGLSGTRRLVDHFELDTTPGEGTRIVVVKWRR